MLYLSYTKQEATTNKPAQLPTLQGVVYTSVEEYEALLESRPHFVEGLCSMMSTIIAHECRNIGF